MIVKCASCQELITQDSIGAWIDMTDGDGCGPGVHYPRDIKLGKLNVPLGKYTFKQRYKFTANEAFYYAGRQVTKASQCQFFETACFCFLYWREPNGRNHLVKE